MKKFTLLFLIFLGHIVSFSQVAINYDGSTPTSHSVLDVKSDTTGMLIPRMTSTQRNTLASKLDSSHEGMIVYDKTGNVLFVWNGNEFEYLSTGVSSEITDTDNDTWVDVEAGTDPDYVEIGSGGVGYWQFKDGRIEYLNVGGSVFLGEKAGYSDDFTGNENVFIGFETGINSTQGYNNVAVGSGSMRASTHANNNVALGRKSMYSNTTGSYNVSMGMLSQYSNSTGSKNVTLGYGSDYFNTAGENNTIIGYQSGYRGTSHTKSGSVFIGYQAGYLESGSNKLYIENSSSSDPLIYGDFSTDLLGFMGDVGIGTKTPQKNLHIMGSATLASLLISPNEAASGDDSEILLAEDNNFTYGMSIKYDGGDNRLYFLGKNDAEVSDPFLTITRDGNVGIGTDNPSEAFEVVTTTDRRTAYFSGEGQGISDATVYADNTSTGSGIAGFFQTAGIDATVVLKQNGNGNFLKAFGPNGGGQEWSVRNDGFMEFFNSGDNRTIAIAPSESGTNDAGQITLYDATGTTATIEIDGAYNGDGRITTNELQITGGSDLSEFFELSDYSSIEKGMVVSIDENNPGQLKVCSTAFDKKVAGIISGANTIQPGLIMSQKGTIADGEHLVALSGRVYCMVDATENPIEIGDMLTTSSTPGHAMRVDDYSQAQGAIIGKAMTSLKEGKGLVLVLVSLQ